MNALGSSLLQVIFSLPPATDMEDRLPPERFDALYQMLCQSGIRVCRDGESRERLRKMRLLYEGYSVALSRYLRMPLPPWVADHPHKDNWLSVARVRAEAEGAPAERVSLNISPIVITDEEHHIF